MAQRAGMSLEGGGEEVGGAQGRSFVKFSAFGEGPTLIGETDEESGARATRLTAKGRRLCDKGVLGEPRLAPLIHLAQGP
jgi:hypothetical protein